MNAENYFVEENENSFEEHLLPPVDICGHEALVDIQELNGLAFELYKEAASCVNLASHLLDENAAVSGGWLRNQAICAGMIVRLTKFMIVVTQLSAGGNRGEVVEALNRSILETAVNLELNCPHFLNHS